MHLEGCADDNGIVRLLVQHQNPLRTDFAKSAGPSSVPSPMQKATMLMTVVASSPVVQIADASSKSGDAGRHSSDKQTLGGTYEM